MKAASIESTSRMTFYKLELFIAFHSVAFNIKRTSPRHSGLGASWLCESWWDQIISFKAWSMKHTTDLVNTFLLVGSFYAYNMWSKCHKGEAETHRTEHPQHKADRTGHYGPPVLSPHISWSIHRSNLSAIMCKFKNVAKVIYEITDKAVLN